MARRFSIELAGLACAHRTAEVARRDFARAACRYGARLARWRAANALARPRVVASWIWVDRRRARARATRGARARGGVDGHRLQSIQRGRSARSMATAPGDSGPPHRYC